ncbi:MAG: tRNA (adenosine(37)-N6)-threonylcarbamoyltransferase complex dimerization subunit type 1 TsaB [Gammaproteobacteria bacterium GWF2_41_13]|nr:MAG: tRNA (adenosine(37)-N6)-threonylcarbamoyltransferase complex dimerization subunit type 1 TsaB [Gammaproteobacteria bacterium GWF2_41_13]
MTTSHPIILALDTSTALCSAALLMNGEIIERSQLAPQQQTHYILPMIQELLTETSLHLTDISCLAFGAGPGAFTGLRIAAAITQGIAFAKNIPITPVSTLAALAQQAFRRYQAIHIMPMLDARMKQIYWGSYQVSSEKIAAAIIEDQLNYPEQIDPAILTSTPWFGIGNGWPLYQPVLPNKPLLRIAQIDPEAYPLASDIALLGVHYFQQGKIYSAKEAIPVYLRNPV